MTDRDLERAADEAFNRQLNDHLDRRYGDHSKKDPDHFDEDRRHADD